jgi:hypothetical protein
MKILLGIIAFHLLVIVRSQVSKKEGPPYISVFFISVLLVLYVIVMLHLLEEPAA